MAAPKTKNIPGRGQYFYDSASDSFVAGELINGAFSVTGSPLSQRAYEDSTYLYRGWAAPGSSESDPVWLVGRLTLSDLTVKWANGSAAFNSSWTDYASLTYS